MSKHSKNINLQDHFSNLKIPAFFDSKVYFLYRPFKEQTVPTKFIREPEVCLNLQVQIHFSIRPQLDLLPS